jgi:hypothetical protein
MWLLLICLVVLIAIGYFIRSNKYLRTHFYDKLYSVGLQYGNHIYTLVSDVYQEECCVDLVILTKHHDHLHVYHVFNRKYSKISLVYPSPIQTLVYQIDNQPKEHLYMEGTPFRVNKGELILYQKKRKGLGFIREEIGRSKQWPFI